jgi:hypothetical protein
MKDLKRWLRGLVLAFLVIFLVLFVLVSGVRVYMNRVGTGELAAVSARLDAEEPGWRLEAIEPARRQAAPPPERNSAPLVLKVADLVTPEHTKAWNTWRGSEEWTTRALSPNLPGEKVRDGMLAQKDSTAAARLLARDLRRFPTGFYPLVIDQNPYMTLLPHVQKARDVAALLEYDALLAAVEQDADGAIASVHAALNVGRSIGDEPLLISQLVRIACGRVSTQSAIQVLAWGEPKNGLTELQAAYRAEADTPFVLYGLRGERAMLHRTFESLESGRITADGLAVLGLQKPGPAQRGVFYLYKAQLPGDHAKALEIVTAYIAAAKLPHPEQQAAFAAIPIPPGPPEDFRYIITRLLVPACQQVAAAGLKARAELLCASAAIACERFRQKHGRWPDRLDEIPAEILPDVPLDPYTGRPLHYQRFEDGIAVYSVGDRDPNKIRRQIESKDPLGSLGVGWRLWNPEARRQPPIPDPTNQEPFEK